jgi:hypothetical protein
MAPFATVARLNVVKHFRLVVCVREAKQRCSTSSALSEARKVRWHGIVLTVGRTAHALCWHRLQLQSRLLAGAGLVL